MAQDKFSRMIMGARKADVDSIRELKDYIYEQSGVANKSLRALEKSGITEYAYGRAMTFLETEYQSIKFPQAVAKRPVEELILQATELRRFLQSPTRTVRGAKAVREAQMRGIRALRDIGYHSPDDPQKVARISRVLGNDGLNFRKNDFRYEIMEAIGEMFDEGMTDEEVQLQIDRYAAGDGGPLYDKIMQALKIG